MRQLIVWVSLWCQETHDNIMKLLLLTLHVTHLGFMAFPSIFWITVEHDLFHSLLIHWLNYRLQFFIC